MNWDMVVMVVLVDFSLACEDFRRMLDHSFPARAFLFFYLFIFLKWRLAHAH